MYNFMYKPYIDPSALYAHMYGNSTPEKEEFRNACQVLGDERKVQRLLKADPSLLNTSLDMYGKTPLHYASMSDKEKVVKVLLEANANIESKDERGQTPLHEASSYGHEKVVKILLEANANIESKDKHGQTPLHYASEWGRENVVKMLLAANADIDAKDNEGKKAEEIIGEKQEIKKMIKEERDRRNKQQQKALTPSSVSQPPPRSFGSSSSYHAKKTAHRNSLKYLALYDFRAQYPDNLSFKKGDIITVTAQNGEWWSGSLNGRSGTLPSNYVSLLPSGSSQTSSLPTPPTVHSSALSASSSSTNATPIFVKKRFPETKYKELYDSTEAPKFSFEVFSAVKTFITIYGKQQSIPDAEVNQFIGKLHEETTKLGGTDELIGEVGTIATRLWTSAKTLNGRELCSIFNQAIRDDIKAMMPTVVVLARGINLICVRRNSRPSEKSEKPEKTYRGGGLPQQHHSFFEVGKQFRTPQFLSTSKDDGTASNFAYKASEDGFEPVVWEFVFHPKFGCKHVNFLKKSNVEGEEEFLFTAYSVFTVRSREIKTQPNWMDPHKIVLEVAPDNRLYPEDLPLAPWA